MKRRILKLCMLLVLGAIVNVAVAWGCGLPRTNSTYNSKSLIDTHDLHVRLSTLGLMPAYDDPGFRFVLRAQVLNAHGCRAFRTVRSEMEIASGQVPQLAGVGPADTQATELQIGWPCLALTGLKTHKEPVYQSPRFAPGPSTYSWAFEAPESWIRRHLPADSWFPVRPLWPGFAINTVFYAAVLWGLLAGFGFVRRRLIIRGRTRRGQCPACAYPIGTNPLCTECGKPVKRQQATA